MSAKARLRILHRKLSPWMFPFLIFSAITGLMYRVGRAWFAMSKETGGNILQLHAGEWLGVNGSVLYLFIIGTSLGLLVLSGFWMWFTSPTPKAPVRKYHRLLAIVLALPLLLTAVTGVVYQAGSKWFHFGEDRLKLLLSLHQGSWLGAAARPYYVIILGTGLIALCLTGLRMLIRKNAPAKVVLE